MRKSVKISLIILSVILVSLILLIIFLGYKTYKDASELYTLISDESLKSDFQRLLEGDCSSVSEVKEKVIRIELKIEKVCKNPISSKVVSKYSSINICGDSQEINNLLLDVERIRTICTNFSPNN